MDDSSNQGHSATPPEHVPSVVDTLDPELSAAYRGGNPTIIQAVAAGATTSQMVVNDVIRMGVVTGLPPGVQQLVDERMKEIQQQQAAENERLKKLGAGVLEGAIMATTGAQADMYYGGEGDKSSSQYKDYSAAEWNSMSAAERKEALVQQQNIAEARYDGARSEADQLSQEILSDPKYGATLAERKAALTRIQGAASEVAHGNNVTQADMDKRLETGDYAAALTDGANSLRTPEEIEAAKRLAAIRLKQNLAGEAADTAVSGATNEDIPEFQRKQHMRTVIKNKEALGKPLTQEEQALKHEDEKRLAIQRYAGVDINGPHDMALATQVARGLVSIEEAEKRLGVKAEDLIRQQAAEKAATQAPATGGPDYIESTKAYEAASVVAKTDADRAALAAELKEDVAVRSVGADRIVAAANKPQADDDYGDAPTQPATAPRLTINNQPLASAGMLQPVGVVAANEAQAPAIPEQQRPRVATPSSGMGGAV